MALPLPNPNASQTFSSRMKTWSRPPRRLTMTTGGKFFVLLTLTVGFGAINTGNNLLFLLMGMLLSLITVSGLLSEAVLRSIHASRKLPARLVAGQETACTYIVKNASDSPSLSLEIADLTATALAGPAALDSRRLGLFRHPWWKVWKKSQNEGRALASAYAVRIEPKSVTEIEGAVNFPVRGRFRLEHVTALTRFPFGLFEKSREWDSEQEVLVEPSPLDEESWRGALLSRLGEVDTHKEGPGEEFFGLREFREGEDARAIHWKSSARRNTLLVRETERRHHRRVVVVVLDRAPAPTGPDYDRFEIGIRRTAGLLHSLHAAGFTIGRGPEDYERILDSLATIALAPGNPILDSKPADATRIVMGLQTSLDATSLDPDDIALSFDEGSS